MDIYQHLEESAGRHLEGYAGLPVFRFNDGTGPDDELPPAAGTAWYVGAPDGRDSFGDVFARFLEAVDTTEITALIIGYWDDADPVEALTEAAASFPKLRALFLGDIVYEELMISVIDHSDISPLFTAFPGLERFEVRGAADLELAPIRSERLKVLRFESGGLPARIVQAVAASELPNLTHLDLWLGSEWYGGDATVADLAPLLGGERLPALRHLGLEDSETQDEIAAAVAGAPVVARLESLSLAMGTLTDRGAEALLSGQPLTHLRKLDLHHHFLSDAMVERVKAAHPGVEVDLSEQDEPNPEWLFAAVTE
ncbi:MULTISPECIES: STM4015 family protein [unclassified Spirillospora]|uniref:STM4015 family protein n=1 Tax=unclassified Spirillospora TaxID=2642701 RepID=UPI003714542F